MNQFRVFCGTGLFVLLFVWTLPSHARDPFHAGVPLKEASMLQWYPLEHRQADELVDWLHQHIGVLGVPSANEKTSAGKVQLGADLNGQRLWLRASARLQARFAKLLPSLDLIRPQIAVEARIVRINNDAKQALGVRWSASSVHHVTDRFGLHMNMGQADCEHSAFGLHVGHLPNGQSLDLELSALESMGLGEIVAMPHLSVSAGQEAVIESGQRIPYQHQSDRHITSTRFEKAVLSLSVIATPLPKKKLALALAIHQDKPEIVPNQAAPIINTQVVQTHVIVPAGQVIVLGGLYEYECHDARERIPWIGNLPIIGALFRHSTLQCARTELLIFLQPQFIDIKDDND